MKNIFELLFERFPTRTNNITSNIESEEDISSKTKQNKNYSKTQLDKKKFYLMLFDDARQRLRYVIKYDRGEGHSNSLTNEGLILDHWKN